MNRFLEGLLALAVFVLAAPATVEARPLQVVATTGMIADMARHIGGEDVEVQALMGSGVDPHLYRATQGDIGKLRRADLIVYNGLFLEGKMGEILERLARYQPTFAMGDAVDSERLIHPQGHGGHPDPHIWFDVALWRDAGEALTARLVELDPGNAADYEARADAYFTELEALHAWVAEQIASIPEKQRVLVTAHDAFSYFGRAYGIEVVGLQGISTATEYGLYDVKRVRELVVDRGVKAVFVESSVPRKFIESLQEGLAASGHQVDIGGELFSDAMGEPGTEAGTYLGMVRHNVNTMVEALR